MQLHNAKFPSVNQPQLNGDGVISNAMVCLVYAWLAATRADREAAIRAIGVADVWDALASVVG
jgi:hypothetical protein